MEKFVYRVMLGYTAFIGPMYKFYATWTEKEGLISYEIESCHPDYSSKGTLDKKQSKLFIKEFYNFIDNKENSSSDPQEIYERYLDVPSFQLVTSQGFHEYELEQWSYGTEPYDMNPLYNMILVCDDKAEFLKAEK